MKKAASSLIILILILFCSFTGFVKAQTTGEVRGFVYDKETGEPIIFTNVYIRELSVGKATDMNGFYALTKLKPGIYEIACYSMGYDTAKESIEITEGVITSQNLFLIKHTKQLNEVEVSAQKQKAQTETRVSNITITQKDLKQLPSFGGEPDLAQYLQVLPGVVFSGDQGGQLYIRGGTPVQNKIMIDGMTIYNPFHSIGLFSVFDADIIRTADVYAGGFNVQYGDRIGAIVDVSTREGNKTRFSGKINVNPITSKVLLEGPVSKFKDGSSASYIVSYKTCYLDKTAPVIYPNAGGTNGLPYSFNDFYGKFSFVGNNGSKFNLFGFSFNDGVSYPANQYNWKSWGVGSNFFLVPSGSTVINGTVAYSDYIMTQTQSDHNERNSEINGFNINMNFTYFIGKNDIKYGFEMNGFNTTFNYINGYGLQLNQNQSQTELCGFVKYKLTAGRFLIEPGLRAQYYASLGEATLEPRFTTKYNMTDKIRLKGAVGYYTQNLMSATSDQDVVNMFYGFISGPTSYDISNSALGFSADANNSKLSKAIHYVAGVEADIGMHGSINVEGFYKDFLQLPAINRDKKYPNTPENAWRPESERLDYIIETGKAYGGDFLYKYEYKHIYFWAVYSLTYVTRNDGKREYFPSFDRRHNVNLVGTYTYGKDASWSFNARWNFGTGFPFTQTQGYYEQLNLSGGPSQNITNQNGTLGVYYADLNGGRLPYFHRLDLSVSKKITFNPHTSLTVIAACTNVYNRSNIFYFDRITYQRINQLPIMPTLGINFSF